MSSEIQLNPIGRIDVQEGRFFLLIKDHYKRGLKEIEGFSHITILWWAHKSESQEQRERLRLKKPYKKGPDTIGVFATRSEIRPNPVLITTAGVLGVDLNKGTIALAWIDAMQDSPVIDIKPYQPCLDRVKYVASPGWCSEWPQFYEASAEFDWELVFDD